MGIIENLTELLQLRLSGIIDKNEFQRMKDEVKAKGDIDLESVKIFSEVKYLGRKGYFRLIVSSHPGRNK